MSGRQEKVQENKKCAVRGCRATGAHRGPFRGNIKEATQWFCLAHVKEKNRAWNYLGNLSEHQAEQKIRAHAVWDRPTWPRGLSHHPKDFPNQKGFPYGLENDFLRAAWEAREGKRESATLPPAISPSSPYGILGLPDHTPWEEVRKHYKDLAKVLHPDRNGGDADAEEKLKRINQAYAEIRKRVLPMRTASV